MEWIALDPVLVTVKSGILAVAGFDIAGRGVAIALALDRVGEEQRVGSTPANATVTIEGGRWEANGSRGGGAIWLSSIDERFVEGGFCFVAGLASSPARQPVSRVTAGSFGVLL